MEKYFRFLDRKNGTFALEFLVGAKDGDYDCALQPGTNVLCRCFKIPLLNVKLKGPENVLGIHRIETEAYLVFVGIEAKKLQSMLLKRFLYLLEVCRPQGIKRVVKTSPVRLEPRYFLRFSFDVSLLYRVFARQQFCLYVFE